MIEDNNLVWVDYYGRLCDDMKSAAVTGDLVKAIPDIAPMIYHYGISVRDGADVYILHTTPGRGAVQDRWEDFFKSRKPVSLQKTCLSGLPVSEVYAKHRAVEKNGFNLFTWNCEHHTRYMSCQEPESPQLKFFLLFLAMVILVILFLRG